MANYNEWIPEEFGSTTESYGEGYSRNVGGKTFYKDPDTGNIYDVPYGQRGYWAHPDEPLPLDFGNAQLVASGEAMKDPYLQNLGINTDPVKAGQLYNLKESNPSEYYKQVANQLSDSISSAWKMNWYSENTKQAENLLENIKEYDPQAYYSAKLADLGQRIGWNYGENSLDAAKTWTDRLNQIIPEAQKAGISADQINSTVSNYANIAGQQNQTRISDLAGNNFWNQNLMGALKIGAFALGASGLDAALGAGATEAGVAGGTSTGGGSSFGSLLAPSSYVSPSAALTADVTGSAIAPSIGSALGGTVGSISVPTTAGALGLAPAAEAAIAAGAGADLITGASSFSPAGIGGLNAALPAAGSVGGAGSMSAALPAGTMIGDGTLGSVLGASYVASAPGQLALDSLGNAIPASSVGLGSGAAAGAPLLNLSPSEVLTGVKMASGLLGAGKNPLQQQVAGIPQQRQQRQYAGVDYSPILSLLALKSPTRTNTLLG